jgi:hypothetical protein
VVWEKCPSDRKTAYFNLAKTGSFTTEILDSRSELQQIMVDLENYHCPARDAEEV